MPVDHTKLTFPHQPGFADIPDSDLDAEDYVVGVQLARIVENAAFGMVRPEIFWGLYYNGDTVAAPTSPVDGYKYSRDELAYAWQASTTGSPGTGWASYNGMLWFMQFFVDPNTGDVTSEVAYVGDVKGSKNQLTNDGQLLVWTFASRRQKSLTLGAEPYYAERADADFDTDNALVTTLAKDLNNDAKFSVINSEAIYMGTYKSGQTIAQPVSPVDGYVYAYDEVIWKWSWVWTTDGDRYKAPALPTYACMSKLTSGVDASGNVTLGVYYCNSSSDPTLRQLPNGGRVAVVAMCQRTPRPPYFGPKHAMQKDADFVEPTTGKLIWVDNYFQEDGFGWLAPYRQWTVTINALAPDLTFSQVVAQHVLDSNSIWWAVASISESFIFADASYIYFGSWSGSGYWIWHRVGWDGSLHGDTGWLNTPVSACLAGGKLVHVDGSGNIFTIDLATWVIDNGGAAVATTHYTSGVTSQCDTNGTNVWILNSQSGVQAYITKFVVATSATTSWAVGSGTASAVYAGKIDGSAFFYWINDSGGARIHRWDMVTHADTHTYAAVYSGASMGPPRGGILPAGLILLNTSDLTVNTTMTAAGNFNPYLGGIHTENFDLQYDPTNHRIFLMGTDYRVHMGETLTDFAGPNYLQEFAWLDASKLFPGNPVKTTTALQLMKNIREATVRPEWFDMGEFSDGDVVPLPASSVDGYTYDKTEIWYLWEFVNTNTGSQPRMAWWHSIVVPGDDPADGYVQGQVIIGVDRIPFGGVGGSGIVDRVNDTKGTLHVWAIAMRQNLQAPPYGHYLPGSAADSSSGSGGGGITEFGGVTKVSAGNLAPIFTTTVTNPNSTPDIEFILSDAPTNQVLAGPASGATAPPAYRDLVADDIAPTSGVPDPAVLKLHSGAMSWEDDTSGGGGGGTIEEPMTSCANGGTVENVFVRFSSGRKDCVVVKRST